MRIVAALVELVGVGLVLVGVWWMFPPAALVIAGMACMGVAFYIDLRGTTRDDSRRPVPPH